MRSNAVRRVIAVVVLLVGGLFATAGPAQALVEDVPQVVEDHLLSLAEYAQREGIDPNTACDTGCQDLGADLERPATAVKDPVPGTVTKSLFDNRFASVAKAFVPRGPIGLTLASSLVYANYRVWRFHVFGAHPKDYFVKLSAAATSPSQLSWQFVDGSSDTWYSTFFDKPDPLPVGAIAQTYGRGAIIWHEGAPGPGSSRCGEQPLTPTPPDVEVYSWHWNTCFEGWVNNQEVYTPMMAFGWKVGPQFFDPPADLPTSPPQYSAFDANPLSPQDMQDRIDTILHSDDPDYDVLKDWACAVFGGACQNPRDAYPTTPDCTGMTATACTQAFRDAGFVGDITTETLNADQAVMEQQAGKVTATYPHEGIEIAAPRAIRIYVNPDPMPAMTAAEVSLADDLEAQNPTSVSASNKRTLAKTCSEDMDAAGRQTSDCLGLPILIMGNDQETPARNALQGLLRNPSWVVLNARVSKGLSRNNWYGNLGEPAPGCLTEEREPATASCDEYPFWSTLQAHNGTLSLPGLESSIRWAPEPEQSLQAKVINQFYSEKSPGDKMWFHGCAITKQPPTDIAPALASSFVVMPLPFSSVIQSTGVCNKVVPTDNTPDPNEDPNP